MRSTQFILALVGVAMLLLAGIASAQDTTGSLDEYQSSVQNMDESGLQAEASRLKGEIESLQKEVASLKDEVKAAADDQKEGAQTKVDEKKVEVDDRAARLQAVVKEMKEKNLDVSDYQVLLINVTGEISTDTLSADAALGVAAYWFDKGKQWAMDYGPSWILKIVVFLVILLVFKVLAKFFGRVTEKALTVSRVQAPELLKNFFVNVVSKCIFIAGLLIALSVLGVPLGPVLAGIGVLGFVVGFALQDTLGNFAAGVMVLLYRPFDIGDFVAAGGVTGTVSAMSLVSTTFLTPDNKMEIVPNGKIWGDTITNVTRNPTRRVDLVFGIGYSDDIDKAEKVLADIVSSHPLVLKDPAPVIKLNELADSSVNFVVRPWSKTSDYWNVYWDLTRTVKQRFDKEGIGIPFPQRDIHIVSGGEALTSNKS